MRKYMLAVCAVITLIMGLTSIDIQSCFADTVPQLQETATDSADGPLNSNHIVTFEYRGEVLFQQTIEDGCTAKYFIPQKQGSRFSGWKDADGNKINPEEYPVTDDTVFTAEFYAAFGTDEPYLYKNDINLILPEDYLTFTDFSKAMCALIPQDSSVRNYGFRCSEEYISGEAIKTFLSTFFSQEELSEIPLSDTVTRREFAVFMNRLTGRSDTRILLTAESLKTVDIKDEDPDRADLLEASVKHICSDSGMAWSEQEPENDWRQYEPYTETNYRKPTEHGTVTRSWGKNDELFMYYLPYGYDENKQYNVLVYLAGSDGDPNWILGADWDFAHSNKIFKTGLTNLTFLDFLIQYGYCDPMIVCTTYTTMGTKRVERYIELVQYAVENYSTYARSSAVEDIIAARKHFAIAGPSNASQSICVAIQNIPDMFAYYGMFSGMYEFDQTIDAFSKLDTIEYLVMNAGEYDYLLQITKKAYDLMSEMDNVKESDFVLVENWGHDMTSFDAGLMTLLFRFNPNTRNIQ